MPGEQLRRSRGRGAGGGRDGAAVRARQRRKRQDQVHRGQVGQRGDAAPGRLADGAPDGDGRPVGSGDGGLGGPGRQGLGAAPVRVWRLEREGRGSSGAAAAAALEVVKGKRGGVASAAEKRTRAAQASDAASPGKLAARRLCRGARRASFLGGGRGLLLELGSSREGAVALPSDSTSLPALSRKASSRSDITFTRTGGQSFCGNSLASRMGVQ